MTTTNSIGVVIVEQKTLYISGFLILCWGRVRVLSVHLLGDLHRGTGYMELDLALSMTLLVAENFP